MANATVGINEPASPNKKLASQSLTRGVDTVHQEEVVIGDGVTDGRVATVTAANALKVDGSAVTQPVSDAGGSLTVDALDFDIRNLAPATDEVVVTGKAADGAAVAGNPVLIAGQDGINAQSIKTDADGELQVDVLSSALPTGAATAANQLPNSHDVTVDNGVGAAAVNIQDGGNVITVDGTVNVGTFPDNEPFNVAQYGGTAVVNGGVAGVPSVGGNVAHDGVDLGNPVKVGGKAAGALPTAVAAADRVDSYVDREGRQIVRPWGAGDWTQVHAPVANTRATTTKTAGGAGVRHVCTGITVVLAAGSTAPAAVNLQVRVRDGISDTGTILWEATISLPATAGAMNGISRSGLLIRGTAVTAMTLEFSAAGGANTVESVSMEGVDITEA